MGHLNELHEKYFDKGFRVIAISDESMGTIENKILKGEETARYWIASDPGGTTKSRFKAGQGGGIPHAYLVDATGKVVMDAHPASISDSHIERLLDGVFDPALGRELHSSLRSAVKSYEKDDVGKAWKAAERYLEDEDAELARDAAFLRERCEARAAFVRKLVEQAVAGKDYETAYDDLDTLVKEYAGMAAADWAAETKKSLDADDAVAQERRAWKDYLKAQSKEEAAEGKEKKLGPARSAYKRIVKKYPGTRAAGLAEEALKRIGE